LLAVSVALVHGGAFLESWEIPFAPLLAVMAAGFMILQKREAMAHELSAKFGKIWVFAEIILFSMVGAQLDFAAAADAGFKGVALVFLALIARSVGTWLSVTGAGFTPKEKLFVVISYLPKATVQAAMGSAPLAAMASAGMATRPGEIILAVAVMSILLTAPAGAIAISWAGSRLLTVDDPEAAIGVDTAARESDALEDDDDR
jgi:NhaP-type Na+/H+ or K+/H+ antiporter